mmetsp:Transcript_134909/g.336646  ORF Transcript_134909/g.336646 Transcript_134909/m.336646 type:complete len:207 (+) Transcript_134909:237-857(+)
MRSAASNCALIASIPSLPTPFTSKTTSPSATGVCGLATDHSSSKVPGLGLATRRWAMAARPTSRPGALRTATRYISPAASPPPSGPSLVVITGPAAAAASAMATCSSPPSTPGAVKSLLPSTAGSVMAASTKPVPATSVVAADAKSSLPEASEACCSAAVAAAGSAAALSSCSLTDSEFVISPTDCKTRSSTSNASGHSLKALAAN